MLLELCVVGEHLGMCIGLNKRVVTVVELVVCERWWSRACDTQPTDAGDWSFSHVCLSALDGADTKLQWSGVNIVC